MSRDGLLPKVFQKIHPRYKTPSFSTLLTGVIVGLGALFLESSLMTDLTSIGTLFAFILVCGGLLILPPVAKEAGKFRIPYLNGRYIIPILLVVFTYLFRERVVQSFSNIGNEGYQEVLFLLFLVIATIITIKTIVKKYSFIPVMGVLSCLYLLIEIPAISWLWFFVWMAIGLTIYFLYGYRNSNLAKPGQQRKL